VGLAVSIALALYRRQDLRVGERKGKPRGAGVRAFASVIVTVYAPLGVLEDAAGDEAATCVRRLDGAVRVPDPQRGQVRSGVLETGSRTGREGGDFHIEEGAREDEGLVDASDEITRKVGNLGDLDRRTRAEHLFFFHGT